jgi:hypothetical protein
MNGHEHGCGTLIGAPCSCGENFTKDEGEIIARGVVVFLTIMVVILSALAMS